ncbi:MAG: M20/M25/M40 family metallo-hydrolase [Bacillota bacterium]
MKIIFQPGEEGPGGAKPMIDDGALDDPAPGPIIGLHLGVIWNIHSGSVGVGQVR